MHKEPHQYQKRVLLVVTGMSPQIVTETLYGLAVQQQPAFVPTEIHIITTEAGAGNAQNALLNPEFGHFHQFCKDYDFDITFSENNIHVLVDANNIPLPDIRTPKDNECCADFITDLVRRFTQDDAVALHVSMAGGRKTMGYYLGYALSLYGREQDRLSHVLVPPSYESLREFYYPTPYAKVINNREGQPFLDAADAEVSLADIPFVSLRRSIPHSLLEGKTSFMRTIEAAKLIEQPLQLVIDFNAKKISASGIDIEVSRADFAMYAWFAMRNAKGLPPIQLEKSASCIDYAKEYLEFYQQYIIGEMDNYDNLLIAFTFDLIDEQPEHELSGMKKEFIQDKLSRLKNAFVSALGENLAERYLVKNIGNRPFSIYNLAIEKEQIELHLNGATLHFTGYS